MSTRSDEEEDSNCSGNTSRNNNARARISGSATRQENMLPAAAAAAMQQEEEQMALLSSAAQARQLWMLDEEAWLLRQQQQQRLPAFVPTASATASRRAADLAALLQQHEHSAARAIAASQEHSARAAIAAAASTSTNLDSSDPSISSRMAAGGFNPAYLNSRQIAALRQEQDLITAFRGRGGDGQSSMQSSSLLMRLLLDDSMTSGGSEQDLAARSNLLRGPSLNPHAFLQEQQGLQQSNALQQLLFEQHHRRHELMAEQTRQQELALVEQRQRQQQLMALHQSMEAESSLFHDYRDIRAARLLQGRGAGVGNPSFSMYMESLALQRRSEEEQHQRAVSASLTSSLVTSHSTHGAPLSATDQLLVMRTRHQAASTEEKGEGAHLDSSSQPSLMSVLLQERRRTLPPSRESMGLRLFPPTNRASDVATATTAQLIPRQQEQNPVRHSPPSEMVNSEKISLDVTRAARPASAAAPSQKRRDGGSDSESSAPPKSGSKKKKRRGNPKDDGGDLKPPETTVSGTPNVARSSTTTSGAVSNVAAPVSSLPDPGAKTKHMWVKTKRKRPEDGRPKRPLSAYNFFFQEERGNMVAAAKTAGRGNQQNTGLSFEALAKTIAPKWKQIDPQAKQRFQEMASCDLERYQLEMQAYNDMKSKKAAPARNEKQESSSGDEK